jgi:alcohol dehydrogenase
VTPVAVISDPDRTLKVGISSPHLIAAVALRIPN